MNIHGFEEITADSLKKYIQSTPEKEYILIDVRQPDEYAKSHIPGALLIPLPDLLKNPAAIPAGKDIIFCCLSGSRSRVAAILTAGRHLVEEPIYTLKGGISGWLGHTSVKPHEIRVFDKAKTFYQFLIAALGLEKGAQQFYSGIQKRQVLSKVKDAFADLAQDEFSHAKMLYGLLEKYVDDPRQPFEQLYEGLTGAVAEGGQTLEQLFHHVHLFQKYTAVEAMDLALDMEFASYDLYWTMARFKTEERETADMLLSIADAEKKHMKLIAESIPG